MGSANRHAVYSMHIAERDGGNRASSDQRHRQVRMGCLHGCRNPLPKHVQRVLEANAVHKICKFLNKKENMEHKDLQHLCATENAYKKHAMQIERCGLGAAPV